MLTITDVIAQSWRFYVKNWGALLTYMALLFLPTALLSALGLIGVAVDKFIPGSMLVSNIIIFVIFLISLAFTFWAVAALTKGIADLLQNPASHSWQSNFSAATPLLWPFAYTTILVGLVVGLGTLFFIIPGIIFTLWYIFAGYSVLLDGQKGLAAMRFSKALVVGRWWSVAVRVVVPGALFGLLFKAVFSALAFPVILFFHGATAIIIINMLSAIGGALNIPLTLVAIIIVYQDAKERPHVPTVIPTQK